MKGLINGAWRTHETISLDARKGKATLRGFYGAYDVTVTYDGVRHSTGSFYLAKGHSATYRVRVR